MFYDAPWTITEREWKSSLRDMICHAYTTRLCRLCHTYTEQRMTQDKLHPLFLLRVSDRHPLRDSNRYLSPCPAIPSLYLYTVFTGMNCVEPRLDSEPVREFSECGLSQTKEKSMSHSSKVDSDEWRESSCRHTGSN